MAQGQADYGPEPVPAPAGPVPRATSLRVSVRRTVWTENPRGSWEVAAGGDYEMDPAHTVRANLDRIFALCRGRVEAWISELPL